MSSCDFSFFRSMNFQNLSLKLKWINVNTTRASLGDHSSESVECFFVESVYNFKKLKNPLTFLSLHQILPKPLELLRISLFIR